MEKLNVLAFGAGVAAGGGASPICAPPSSEDLDETALARVRQQVRLPGSKTGESCSGRARAAESLSQAPITSWLEFTLLMRLYTLFRWL